MNFYLPPRGDLLELELLELPEDLLEEPDRTDPELLELELPLDLIEPELLELLLEDPMLDLELLLLEDLLLKEGVLEDLVLDCILDRLLLPLLGEVELLFLCGLLS